MHRNNAVGCGTCADTCELRLCPNAVCPHIDHRMELGLVTYREAVLSIIPNTPRLLPRLEKLIQQYPGYLWLSAEHKNRMDCLNYELGYVHRRNTNRYYHPCHQHQNFHAARNRRIYRHDAENHESGSCNRLSVCHFPFPQKKRQIKNEETEISSYP